MSSEEILSYNINLCASSAIGQGILGPANWERVCDASTSEVPLLKQSSEHHTGWDVELRQK